MLTKNQYYNENASNFRGMTQAEKLSRYQRYTRRYNRGKKVTVPVTRIPPVINTNRKVVKRPNGNRDVKFSKCLIDYAKASVNPFEDEIELPCIPDNIILHSYKTKVFCESVIVVGTGRCGFALFNPWYALMNQGAHDAPANAADYALLTSLPAYNYDHLNIAVSDFAVAGGTKIAIANSNSIFDRNTVGGADGHGRAGFRVVAAGMEMEYTGTLMNQAGTVTTLQNQNLGQFPNPYTTNQILTNQLSSTCANARENKCYVRYESTAENYNSYHSMFVYSPLFTATNSNLWYPLLIFVSGAEPGTTFRVRAVAYFEVQKETLPASPSHSDPIGYSAFLTARSQVKATNQPQNDLLNIMTKAAKVIVSGFSSYAPAVGTAIGAVFGQPVLGGLAGAASKSMIEALLN